MLECNTDEELMEILLAIVACSPYPKVIPYIDKKGRKNSYIDMSWHMTLAEEQNFVPLASCPSSNVPYHIICSNKSELVAYVPMHSIEH